MLSITRTKQIKMQIRQAFKFAYYSSDTNQELNSRLEKIISQYPKSITNYERWYFKGIFELLRDQYMEEHFDFCYEVEGKLYKVRKQLFKDDAIIDNNKPILTDFCTVNKDTPNGFYYKKNNIRYSGKDQ